MYASEPRQVSAHSSSLLDKARALGLRLPLDLERLAIARGCDYYERELSPRVPPLGEVAFSNAELAIALIMASRPPKAREIRLAAALLGSSGVRAEEVATLAVERIARMSAGSPHPERLLQALDQALDHEVRPHP